MAEDTSKLQPAQIKKLLKVQEAVDDMVKNKELTRDQASTFMDEAVRELRAHNESIMGKVIDPAMKKAVGGYKKFVEKATPAVARGIQDLTPQAMMHPMQAASGQMQPGPTANFLAQQAVPQDLTTAATDAAMMATQAGPIAKGLKGVPAVLRWAAEYGAPAAAGGFVAPYEGKTREQGSAQGLAQVGLGKATAGISNFLGKPNETKYANQITSSLGAKLKEIMKNYSGPLKTVQDFYRAFVRGNAPKEVGKALTATEGSIARHLGGQKLTLPDLQNARINILGSDPQTTPAEYTLPEAMSFYRKIRNKGYGARGELLASSAGYPTQREIRYAAHDIRDQIISEVESFAPQYGSILDDALRQDALAKTFNSMFGEQDLQKGMLSGQMPVSELQLRLNGSRDIGYSEDLDRVLGNTAITDSIIQSAQSGAPVGAGIDRPLSNTGIRVYGSPTRPGSAHLGASMDMLRKLFATHRVGAPTPKWPRITGAVPGILEQSPARKLSEIEAPEEGEPVTP